MLKEHAFRSRDPVRFLFALVYAFLYKSSIFLPQFVAVLILGKVSCVCLSVSCVGVLIAWWGVDCLCDLVTMSRFVFLAVRVSQIQIFEVAGEWQTGLM